MDFLDVAKAAGYTFIAVGVEGVEVDRHPCVNTGVNLRALENRLDLPVHNLGCGIAVGVYKIAVGIRFVVGTVDVAITEGQLEGSLVRYLAAELTLCSCSVPPSPGSVGTILDLFDYPSFVDIPQPRS